MKKIAVFFTSVCIAAMVNAQTPATVKAASSNATAANAATTSSATTPKADISKILEFKEENHDFGKIPYGKPVEFDVLIKNIGQEPVKI
ncbi:MAG TPA: hypothetical protein VF700_05060, partial [Segetibacter sp.]